MSDSKAERWLTIIERVIALIKPKFHNAITRTVVLLGLAIAVESQINIFEAFSVAMYESYFGQSDYLRNLFSSTTNSWIGVVFVIFGLIYNAVVTVGVELIQKYKEAIPKEPEFKFSFQNSDAVELKDNIVLRGKRCTHSIIRIPDNDSYSDRVEEKMQKKRSVSSFFVSPPSFDDPEVNVNFYRERAKFLRTWGGAEIIRLSILNSGIILANNVRVELTIDRINGLTVSNENSIHPDIPVQETQSHMFSYLTNNNIASVYDIKESHTKLNFSFEWTVGNLQAKAESKSETRIFLRTESEININICIYCDQLSHPISKTYRVSPTSETFEFDLDFLKLNAPDFLNSMDSYVMDGYLGRYYDDLLKEYHQSNEVLLP